MYLFVVITHLFNECHIKIAFNKKIECNFSFVSSELLLHVLW